MSLFNLNVEKSKRSLEVRNEVIEMIREKFDMNFGYSFNDLYKVKGGVVRRLKGGLRRFDYGFLNMKEYNKIFNEVKEFVDNLNIEDFDIKLNKVSGYSFDGDGGKKDYIIWKDNGYEGNYVDFINELKFNEGTLILKIKWNV